MSETKSILIVEDHPLYRDGLKMLLERQPKFTVVGEAGDGATALSLARELKPEIILLDISLPDLSGIELSRALMEVVPGSRILIVSMHAKIEYVTEAFHAGAFGYVLKEAAGERLVQALEAVSKGEYYLDSSLSQWVVKKLMELPGKEAKVVDKSYETLTAREQQILRMVAEGLSSKAIAAALCISPKTVENHRAKIMEKLNLHNTVELVRYASRLGLIDTDLWKM